MSNNDKKTYVLHHVTDDKNTKAIEKNGLTAGMICSEANMAGCSDDLHEIEEMNDEHRARIVFNDLLRYNKIDKEHPDHDYGNFFWSDDMTARYHRKAMDHKNPVTRYRIVQVYAPKIPCTCYESDFQKAEDLFQYVLDNIDDLERINNTGAEDENDKNIERRADKLALNYYKSMKKWTGKSDGDKEIICPCDIPKKSIVRIV